MNTINKDTANPALISIIENPRQVILLDTNALLAPDRSGENRKLKPISFEVFRDEWIEPLLDAFPCMAIHEAVLAEIITPLERNYVDEQLKREPPRLTLLSDADLNPQEEILRRTIEHRIAAHTAYNPTLDKGADRGEVKSLAYIATKGLLYFCSHDSNALRLIEHAEKLDTNLDTVAALKFYEVLYYLNKRQIGNSVILRMIYKYLYYLTKKEKAANPRAMDKLYESAFSHS